jgi:hypothetical protein
VNVNPPPPVTGRLVTGDGLADLFAEAAVLSIFKGDAEQLYWLGAITSGGKIVGLSLRKFGTGQVYQLAYDGAAWSCDCPDCTFRERDCKHLLAVSDAFRHPVA